MHKLNRLALGAIVVTMATSTLGLAPAAAATAGPAPVTTVSAGPSTTVSSTSVGICRKWPRLCGIVGAPVALVRSSR